MNLGDLFATLSYGELSNLSLANDGEGSIPEKHQPKIINYANEGLLKLYARFVLVEKDLVIQLLDGVMNYALLPKFAASYVAIGTNDNEQLRFIRDSQDNPFTGDIIKVLGVYDNCHHKVPLNDESQPMSVFTPRANLLQVPCICPGRMLSLTYQAKHRKLQNELEEVIELPDVLFPALTAFIAYKVFSHMNTDSSTAKAQEHLAFFEATCASAVDEDLVNSSISLSNSRFTQRGWI